MTGSITSCFQWYRWREYGDMHAWWESWDDNNKNGRGHDGDGYHDNDEEEEESNKDDD